MEHRRFQRVKFAALGDLRHQGMTYRVRLENLSMQGALVSCDEYILIPKGDFCTLSIRLDAQDTLLVLPTQIMHSFFSMVGVRFAALDQDAEQQLSELLQNRNVEPDEPEHEWQESTQLHR